PPGIEDVEQRVRPGVTAEQPAYRAHRDQDEPGGREEDAEPPELEAFGNEIEPRLLAALDIMLPEPVEQGAVRRESRRGEPSRVREEGGEQRQEDRQRENNADPQPQRVAQGMVDAIRNRVRARVAKEPIVERSVMIG